MLRVDLVRGAIRHVELLGYTLAGSSIRMSSFVLVVSAALTIASGMSGRSPAIGQERGGIAASASGMASPTRASERAVPRAGRPMAAQEDDGAAKELSATFAECMARAGTQHVPRAACLTAERDRQDRRLNNIYRELIGSLQGERRARMVEAQRQWVQLRQRDQAFEASILDALGPMADLQSVENDARAIGQRADLLEKYLELSRL